MVGPVVTAAAPPVVASPPRVEALIVPVLVKVSDPPAPTIIAAVVLVPLVMAENAGAADAQPTLVSDPRVPLRQVGAVLAVVVIVGKETPLALMSMVSVVPEL